MSDYKVLARRYRPKKFSEVVGQEAIVTTLKNAMKRSSIAHAYLFCGSRGTGKTTLARVFAKALNCLQPNDGEPCGECISCKGIDSCSSLDVLEIDGASHRGIDDIRQINDTVGYSSASGKYKIYIIDEVHMLTKEAFNALLKTLEEPPAKVKFFFATTEAHKVPATILSRCQRFNLNRISIPEIMKKLAQITAELNVTIEEDALRMLANSADGGLRDAESLLDQAVTFHEGKITAEAISSILGVMPREVLFELDKAGHEGRLIMAFEVANKLFAQGKDVPAFITGLIEHFRHILLIKLAGETAPYLHLSDEEKKRYVVSAQYYSQEQCLTILEFLSEEQGNSRFVGSGRIALEALLLRILRSHRRITADALVHKLMELEQRLQQPMPKMAATPAKVEEPISKPKMLMKEDPTPTPADLGIKVKPIVPEKASIPVEVGARLTEEAQAVHLNKQSRYDTVMQFAAVELEGTLNKG